MLPTAKLNGCISGSISAAILFWFALGTFSIKVMWGLNTLCLGPVLYASVCSLCSVTIALSSFLWSERSERVVLGENPQNHTGGLFSNTPVWVSNASIGEVVAAMFRTTPINSLACVGASWNGGNSIICGGSLYWLVSLKWLRKSCTSVCMCFGGTTITTYVSVGCVRIVL